jgi:hypothetical protein
MVINRMDFKMEKLINDHSNVLADMVDGLVV